MKKGFQFKLEAVLKMRKLAEDQVKMQIGRVNVKINELRTQVAEHNAGIDQAYEAQEAELARGLDGQELRFHPYFVEGKRAHIGYLESQIKMYESEVERLYLELNRKRADVKVIEKLKEKEHKEYKKNLEKKRAEQLEESVLSWFDRKQREA